MFAHKARVADLYQRYFTELVAFLSRRVASRELATDLVQDLFVRLLARDDLVAAVAHDRGYLYSSVRHLAAEARRSPRWREHASDPRVEMESEEAPPPEALIEDRQTIARLAKVVGRLPPRCREAFILHKFEHLSYKEVAAQMGISVGSVERHMARALGSCRAEIEFRASD
ncbi:MAG TPA: sigma-70 family RNA polymerase sigma factor [Rhodocyclaceae bacterium]|nr:sigma-70 family RNA polymerase sigma factor [Rhodocyclaceae bacterium]